MFTPGSLNNTLSNIHERAVRLIHRDHEKLFSSIWIKNIDRKTLLKSLEFLAIEIYKYRNDLPPPIMNDTLKIFGSFKTFLLQLKTM